MHACMHSSLADAGRAVLCWGARGRYAARVGQVLSCTAEVPLPVAPRVVDDFLPDITVPDEYDAGKVRGPT